VEYIDLPPIRSVRGAVTLPGSKSISNRTLLLAALAEGPTVIHDLLESDDTGYMLAALKALGVTCTEGVDGLTVAGAGGRFPELRGELFLGNAGTAFRPLTAVLALNGGDYRLSGVPRMHERPIGDLVDALRQLGAQIDYLGYPGYPPLGIRPVQLNESRHVTVRGNTSSQFVTALLLAAPLVGRELTIEVTGELISKPYVEITLNLMQRFGVGVERHEWSRFTIPAGARYRSPGRIYVEGDASAASYFLAAGAIAGLTGGGPVRVHGVGRGSIQGDIQFSAALERMGAKVTMGDNWIEAAAGVDAARNGRLSAIDGDFNHIPDAAMTLAVAALFADGPSTLRNIGSWRVKETDRIAALARELRKLGAQVVEGDDSLAITPPPLLTGGAVLDTYDDHRMAMSLSLAALGGVTVRINDPECVRKTFPDYFQVLRTISER
jgi:3-phosphoshikimate 1-carboxyvinyltransferase